MVKPRPRDGVDAEEQPVVRAVELDRLAPGAWITRGLPMTVTLLPPIFFSCRAPVTEPAGALPRTGLRAWAAGAQSEDDGGDEAVRESHSLSPRV